MKALENNQQEELQDAPILRSLRKDAPFEAPEGYFDRLPQIMAERLAGADPIQEAPRLAQAGTAHLFRVPDGYFEALPGRIMRHIRQQQKPDAQLRRLWSDVFRPQYALSVAAVVLLFVMSVWIMPREVNDSFGASTQAETQLSSEELLAMMDIDNIDTETLIEILGEESIAGLHLMGEWQIPDEEVDHLFEMIDFKDLDADAVW